MHEAALLKALGTAIRLRRIHLGKSQESFADQIGMHRAYYSAIERGEKNLTLTTLERLAHGLDAALSDLFVEAGR